MMDKKQVTIGVLALQGAFLEHMDHLRELGARPKKVRTPEDLDGLDGIILPGGESTAMRKGLDTYGLFDPLLKKISGGLPAWGTCAGLILLSSSITDDDTVHLALMDMETTRNAYGRQLGSFHHTAHLPFLGDAPYPMVFIRAPYIRQTGPSVTPLVKVEGRLVAARQGHMLATAFHPELTDDLRFTRYFIDMCLTQ